MGDHTEAVAIDFDPAVISYEALLERFWASHHCGSGSWGRQYMNAVFYHNDGQRMLAEASRKTAARKQGLAPDKAKTAILPVGRFTYAEGYHQKYALPRNSEVRLFLQEVYPSAKELADSTVATRLNAFLGSGYDRDVAVLENEIATYGLPEKLEAQVLEKARKRRSR
jgi:peptide-methionine (S)-S-oxide reductase